MNTRKEDAVVARMLKNVNLLLAAPRPWKLIWRDNQSPMIIDDNGDVVAHLKTGDISGVYPVERVIANGKSMILNSEKLFNCCESFSLHTPKELEVKYCPFCGQKLKNK